MKLRELKHGDFFTLKSFSGKTPTDKQVYIKGEYDRSSRKYDCGRCDDISYSRSFKADTEIYTDFTY